MKSEPPFLDRDLSWLGFNDRVLQEAADESVPLMERLKFLAIFSANLDEFFQVRVAMLKGLEELKKKKQKKLGISPKKLLKEIHKRVDNQQKKFGKLYRRKIQKELEANGIFIVEKPQTTSQSGFIDDFFHAKLKPLLEPGFIDPKDPPPFLQNKKLYFAIKLLTKSERLQHVLHAILEIPTDSLPRFIELPQSNGQYFVMFLDDIIRQKLPEIFENYEIVSAHSIKLSRDAELYINDEFPGDLKEKIQKGLANRKTGAPARFLFDPDMPRDMLHYLMETFSLEAEDLVAGGRYHNFSDFIDFPNPLSPKLAYEPLEYLGHPKLQSDKCLFAQISETDKALHFPYHSYNQVIDFLNIAATDPDVEEIKISLYRVRKKKSKVVQALLRALEAGKKITVFVEVTARFDEKNNLNWADELESKGAKVLYSMPGWKVHAKLCLVVRRENGQIHRYAYLATGNFNEKTARIYTDHALLTADPRLTHDVEHVFNHLIRGEILPRELVCEAKHLWVAPFNLRENLMVCIDEEIKHARDGKQAYMYLKMNSLEDSEMIEKLYEASRAGVEIHLLVRGICRLVPGVKDLSDNIQIHSIIDRFLEHGRMFLFSGGGTKKLYVGSADWMTRNLNRRIETVFPIYEPEIFEELSTILMIGFSDNQKARIVDPKLKNKYRKGENGQPKLRSQTEIYEYLSSKSRGI